MNNSKIFNPNRPELAPYGLTCELWKPQPLPRFDRHNEIEINFFPKHGASYLISNRIIDIPPNRLVMFWALTPHKTMTFPGKEEYYVCTIPLTSFLSWKVDENMQHKLLHGEVLVAANEMTAEYDRHLLQMWHNNLSDDTHTMQETIMLEMKARLKRFAMEYEQLEKNREQSYSNENGKRFL